ncbi:hypothetical protein [Bradyrhizobium japonicum]|uniref:hypothetical protein n=1 Tax=Bradyrhizobium japonicum TaxID=375 RepID=UPI0027153221|nr:hypothetical protein [Bradyrhizobium japonicum]WLB51067.1 hypothetical protein QIH94_27295 [Bradyrhizobium japonicum]WLB67159.1 hypothetical protein QIH96_19030 [Bradyrhizobium japonicum]
MSKVLVDEPPVSLLRGSGGRGGHWKNATPTLKLLGAGELKGDVAASNAAEHDVRPKAGVMLDLYQRGWGACYVRPAAKSVQGGQKPQCGAKASQPEADIGGQFSHGANLSPDRAAAPP